VGKRIRDGSQRSEDNPDGSKRLCNEDDESEIEYIDENGKKRRAKRRSKNDLDGRDYKCSFCAKTYLSYPALYTHMKTKHSKGSDGQYLLLNSGRGRGRPKKNAGRVTTIDPESDDYFKTLDKGGGPTDPLYYIDKIIEEYFSDKGIKSHNNEEKINELTKIEESKANEDMPPPSLPEESKDMNDDTSDLKIESEEMRKSAEDQLSNQQKSEMKDESEEGKSESQYRHNYDSRKSAFKQFDFLTYNVYKEYPLFKILSKKRLFDGQDLIDPKIEMKEEHNGTEENQGDKEEVDDPKIDNEVKEESKNDDTIEDKDDHSEHAQSPLQVKSEVPQVENTEHSKDHKEHDGNSSDASDTHEEIRYGKKRFDQVLDDYEALTFEQKQRLSCDDVCGIYLREVSQKVNTKFYKTLLRFVILFRECCNEYGWQKVIETEKLLANEKIKVDLPLTSIPSTHKNALQQQQMIIIMDIAKKSKDGKEDF
jgi:hypothetical protein